jgi:hypothetical protein
LCAGGRIAIFAAVVEPDCIIASPGDALVFGEYGFNGLLAALPTPIDSLFAGAVEACASADFLFLVSSAAGARWKVLPFSWGSTCMTFKGTGDILVVGVCGGLIDACALCCGGITGTLFGRLGEFEVDDVFARCASVLVFVSLDLSRVLSGEVGAGTGRELLIDVVPPLSHDMRRV